ncbi:hypothetical protein HMSSN139_58130 [Paenibacillus sp. HMSSN-139]|nr:hypothetical protein HMSSN139_58130 [Paenibacillus sp. HMSSN-139]
MAAANRSSSRRFSRKYAKLKGITAGYAFELAATGSVERLPPGRFFALRNVNILENLRNSIEHPAANRDDGIGGFCFQAMSGKQNPN